MNADRILETFNQHQVACILIGGMNFLLRHAPILTFDVDLWIEDVPQNLAKAEGALAELQAQWGPSERDWTPVFTRQPGWLLVQQVFCLTSPFGAIDVFRSVMGLASWEVCHARAEARQTMAGVRYLGLSDADMLECQMALPEGERKLDRIVALNQAMGLDQ